MALLVDGEEVDGSGPVFSGGPGVDPGGLEAGVAEELGDDDEIGAAAHEGGGEGVPQDMRGGVVVEARVCRDAGDDGVGSSDAEAPAALVEEERRAVVGTGPVGALVEPVGEGGAQMGVDRDLPGPFAFAEDS